MPKRYAAAYREHLTTALHAKQGGDRKRMHSRIGQIREVEREALEVAGAVPFNTLAPGAVFMRGGGGLYLKRDREKVSRFIGEGFDSHTYRYNADSTEPVLTGDSIEAIEKIIGYRE